MPWVKLVWSLYDPTKPPHAQTVRGSFWWKDIFKLIGTYRSVTISKVNNGRDTLFWKDFWHDHSLLCDRFPRLFSFVINEDCSVADMASLLDLSNYFVLPLSVQAFNELEQLNEMMSTLDLSLDDTDCDIRSFPWGSAQYTSAKFYNFLFSHTIQDPSLQAIWKSRCLPKLRVFAWLLQKDRLNTRDLMQRKHWHLDSGFTCALCSSNHVETRDHLFFDCNFAKTCWNSIGLIWDTSISISQRLDLARRNFIGPCFMEIVICAFWNIWRSRNDLIFKSQQPSLARWKVTF